MQGLRIRDLAPAGYLALDVRHLLALLGDKADSSQWLASDVEATGTRCSELEKLGDEGTRISGTHFKALANSVQQVIDGEFAGFRDGESEPWVIIRAVDSSYFEFFSADVLVLARVRASFHHVEDCEYEAE